MPLKITQRITETIRIFIPTEEYLDKGHYYQNIAQRTFDNADCSMEIFRWYAKAGKNTADCAVG